SDATPAGSHSANSKVKRTTHPAVGPDSDQVLWDRPNQVNADPKRTRARHAQCQACATVRACLILNHMVQYSPTHFNTSFAALAPAPRRGVLEQLARGAASITDLAHRFEMTLTGMKKHVGVLEDAGLVTTEKVGRVRTCRLGSSRLEEEAAWIERF